MKRTIEFIGLSFGWFAIIAQFILMILNRQEGLTETIIRFFSFFTILTNLLVTLFFTAKALNLHKKAFGIFHKKETSTARITSYNVCYTKLLRCSSSSTNSCKPFGSQIFLKAIV